MSGTYYVGKAMSLALLVGPVLLAWLLWGWFDPAGFWQNIVCFCIVALAFIVTASVCWVLAIALWVVD